MLYRAHAFIACHRSEVTVFFEARAGQEPLDRLRELCALAWQIPKGLVEAYNVHSETELRVMWGPSDDDAALLQIGDGIDGPSYCSPEHTQVLTGPYWACRLATAREHANTRITRRRRAAMRKLLDQIDPMAAARRAGQTAGMAQAQWERAL